MPLLTLNLDGSLEFSYDPLVTGVIDSSTQRYEVRGDFLLRAGTMFFVNLQLCSLALRPDVHQDIKLHEERIRAFQDFGLGSGPPVEWVIGIAWVIVFLFGVAVFNAETVHNQKFRNGAPDDGKGAKILWLLVRVGCKAK